MGRTQGHPNRKGVTRRGRHPGSWGERGEKGEEEDEPAWFGGGRYAAYGEHARARMADRG